MHKKIFIIGIIILFIFSEVSPIIIGSDVKISNEDEQISFASDDGLMDSPWPIFQHDIKHTGRSPYGKFGNYHVQKWKFNMGEIVVSSPIIDKDKIIYIGGWNDFYSINPNGNLIWTYEFKYGHVESAAAIDENGGIYFGTTLSSFDDYFYALYPNGTLKWKYLVDDVFSSPVIGNDGTIYFGDSDNYLKALYPSGTLRWKFETGDVIRSSPAIGDDGTIYCGSHDGYLYAIYTNGTEKWKYNVGCWIGGGPTIADDGTIYFSGVQKATLYALYPNGTYKWHVTLGVNVVSTPALAEDSTIYVASYKEGGGAYINSINPNNGSINWRYEVEDEAMSASPAIDKYGIIYIGGWKSNNEVGGNLYALNPNGTLKWVFHTGDSIHSSAAIEEDGTIYVGSWDGYLYAIEPINDDPPEKPIITGQINGKPRTEYTYTATTSDPDSDNVSCFFDWGDGKNSGWTEFVPSDSPVSRSHSWNWRGKYTIKVKAKDVYNMEGDWQTLVVTMPHSKTTNINTVFEKLLEQFPILLKFLQKLKLH